MVEHRARSSTSPAHEALGPRSFILHETARSHHWSGRGLLSIKSFTGGRGLYNTGGGYRAVDDGVYLILNDGQEYSITVDSESKVESFCLFFEPGLIDDVYRNASESDSRLLDEPGRPASHPVRFFDRTYQHDSSLSPSLWSLRTSHASGSCRPGWLEEQLRSIALQLVRVHSRTTGEVDNLSPVRASTREELYRRLHRARDYMEAFFDSSLSLNEIAQVACLSPNHLLRTFNQAFGCTPHQYLIKIRIQQARRLLAETNLPVTSVCLSVGFESLGSFSTLFRRIVGLSPEKFRVSKR